MELYLDHLIQHLNQYAMCIHRKWYFLKLLIIWEEIIIYSSYLVVFAYSGILLMP